MRRSTRPLVAALLTGLLVGTIAVGAGAAQQDVALRALNAQRAANGIPANVVDEPNADAGCAAHDSYMHRNGVFGHGEDPAKPGYSTLGDIFRQPYGEVLASGGGSFGSWQQDGVGPWESAPIHLLALLDPNNNVAGADESYGFDCVRMAHRGPVATGFYSYPGPDRTDVAASEQAAEWPYTPQEKAGLAADATTGPNILLWGQCPPRQATLTGPDGPVAAVLVNYRQVPDYFYNDGDLIPVKPLQPLARYTVNVDWSCGSQSFSFTTAGKANPLALDVDSQRPERVVLRAQGGPLQAQATLTGPSGQRSVALHRTGSSLVSKPLRLGAGHYRACVSSGGQGTLLRRGDGLSGVRSSRHRHRLRHRLAGPPAGAHDRVRPHGQASLPRPAAPARGQRRLQLRPDLHQQAALHQDGHARGAPGDQLAGASDADPVQRPLRDRRLPLQRSRLQRPRPVPRLPLDVQPLSPDRPVRGRRGVGAAWPQGRRHLPDAHLRTPEKKGHSK